MTPYETDIAFLESLNPKVLNPDGYWLVERDEANYWITHQEPAKESQVGVWTINAESNFNHADIDEWAHHGDLAKSFENTQKIALYLVTIENLPTYE